MTDLIIRAATTADAAALFDIERTAALAAFAAILDPPFPDEEIRADWKAKLVDPDREVLIGERAGRPLGFATHKQEMLEQLYVLPEEQGRGVGAALHDLVLDKQRAAGAELCRLWVLEANTRARTFYERRGWHADGETRPIDRAPHPRALRYEIAL